MGDRNWGLKEGEGSSQVLLQACRAEGRRLEWAEAGTQDRGCLEGIWPLVGTRDKGHMGQQDGDPGHPEVEERVWVGPWYLEGWMGNEAVEITNRGGDVHRNSPLLLRWRFGRLWGGHDCGCFLEKSGGAKGTARELSTTTPPPKTFCASHIATHPPSSRAPFSCLYHPPPPTFNTRSSKLLARARGTLEEEAEPVSPLGPSVCPAVSLSSSSPPPKSSGSSRWLRLSNPGAGTG